MKLTKLSALAAILALTLLIFAGCAGQEPEAAATDPTAAPTEVVIEVTIGSAVYGPETTALTLAPEEFNLDELIAGLEVLTNVTEVHLPGTVLTQEQVDALSALRPGLNLTYSLELLGNVYPMDVTELNLSAIQAEEVQTAAAQLSRFSAVTAVELMDESGVSALAPADVKLLQEALPGALFHYSFDLFGKTVSTTDERIEYFNVRIGNKGEEEIRQALDILTSCTYFKLDDCGIDSEVMAGIRDDYPDVKVVWRIYADYFTMCTDETMIRMTFYLEDQDVSELKYCTDVTYMDIGHNESLRDISFIEYMPNLECAIISGAPITDLSCLEDHDKLTWLELCFCSVTDLSVLSTCDNLKYLNVSYSFVSDLSPLDNLKLERMNCMNTRVPAEEANRFMELHPDCINVFKGSQCYGYGWRYNDHGYTFFDYYANMRKVFRYDDKGYYGNMKE